MKLFSGTGTRIRTFTAGTLFLVAIFILPMTTYAAGTGVPFFGPIIPDGTCAAGWGMVLEVVNRTISFLLTLAIVFVAPLMIAWAGFLFLTSGAAPSNREQARSILMNTVIGIVVALAGWIIVDEVMLAFYNADKVKKISWSQLITSGVESQCLVQSGTDGVLNQAKRDVALGIGGVIDPNFSKFNPAAQTSGACSSSTLRNLASSLELKDKKIYPLTERQANTFACLAKYESSCGRVLQNYSWDIGNKEGIASTAYGPFQVLLKSNSDYFEIPACRAAAGVGPSTKLNCYDGFGDNGFTKNGDAAVLNSCKKAAANLSCNFGAALGLFKEQGFGAWTADNAKKNQVTCIQTFNK